MTVQIRSETARDIDPIGRVIERAFGRPQEASLVDAIRIAGHDGLSLVAVDQDAVVGHVLFSQVHVVGEGVRLRGMGLAPMAVDPRFQRRGIGSQLVREGLRRLDTNACPFVLVLGHPEYYPRFGFEPASRFRIRSKWEGIPEDAFLIRIRPGSAAPVPGGTAHYLPEFDRSW